MLINSNPFRRNVASDMLNLKVDGATTHDDRSDQSTRLLMMASYVFHNDELRMHLSLSYNYLKMEGRANVGLAAREEGGFRPFRAHWAI